MAARAAFTVEQHEGAATVLVAAHDRGELSSEGLVVSLNAMYMEALRCPSCGHVQDHDCGCTCCGNQEET